MHRGNVVANGSWEDLSANERTVIGLTKQGRLVVGNESVAPTSNIG